MCVCMLCAKSDSLELFTRWKCIAFRRWVTVFLSLSFFNSQVTTVQACCMLYVCALQNELTKKISFEKCFWPCNKYSQYQGVHCVPLLLAFSTLMRYAQIIILHAADLDFSKSPLYTFVAIVLFSQKKFTNSWAH